MSDAFTEYEKAARLEGKEPDTKVEAPTVGDQGAVDRVLNPKEGDRPSTTLMGQDKGKQADQVQQSPTSVGDSGSGAKSHAHSEASGPVFIKDKSPSGGNPWIFWAAVLLVGIALGFWLKGCQLPEIKEVESNKAELMAAQASNLDLQKKVKKLEGDNAWLRHLLKIEQEKNDTLRKALSDANQYRKWAIEALRTFYATPFAEGHGSRRMCFVFNGDEKCYQLTRPKQEPQLLEGQL